jgi:di/tricarboxylate transporter
MPPLDRALLSDARALAASLIFIGSYFVFALGKFPWMKIDRPGAAIIGAVLMVAFRIVGAPEALASIDFSTIVLLFSMMVVAANLRLADSSTASRDDRAAAPASSPADGHLFERPAVGVPRQRHRVPRDDAAGRAHDTPLAPLPYVIAVATASNIGSTAAITGNPQNMLIGSLGIAYLDFLAHPHRWRWPACS